jgi:hypothetical protein
LRWLGSHARGDPQKHNVDTTQGDSTRVLRKPASFFVRLHVYFEKERGADSATKLMTSDRARRIAANIAKLPDLLGRGAPVEEQRRLYGAAARHDGRGDDDAAGICHDSA